MKNPNQHLKLIQENINLSRQGRPDRRGDRQVNPKIHGTGLKNNFSSTQNQFQKEKKIGESFIFQLIKDNDKPINYRKLGLSLLAEINKEKVMVRVDNVNTFNTKLDDFTAEKIAQTRVVNYSEFANLNEFVFLTPKEKMGSLLSSSMIENSNTYILDIQLYTGDDSMRQIHLNTGLFKEYLLKHNIIVIDDCIMENLVLIKVQLRGHQIYNLLEHKNVYFADFPQESIYNLNGYHIKDVQKLPTIAPPPTNAPFIAVIDSGVLSTHPLLEGSVVASETFGNFPHPFDENGHGTMVAGIIQYGDVYSAIKNNTNLVAPYNLLSGRVTNKDNSFPDDKLLINVVKDAIQYFSNEYKCNIFNISLGDRRRPYIPGTKMDSWSYMLDQLSHDLNIVIVVSSGNYFPAENNEEVLDNYTNFLLDDPDASLIPPSLSVSSITVGSKVKDDVPYTSSRKLSHLAIGSKEQISPFSRSGFGYSNSIKPETIAYGGNFSFNTQIKRINENDRNLGIFSTSIFDSDTGSWFETRSGTSFSAPYITHLLGKIKYDLPNATGNLMRALLINTSNPDTLINNFIIDKFKGSDLKNSEILSKVKRIQGYGEIRENYLVNSFDNFVTMYHEGEIGTDKVNVFEIPIPKDIYSKKGKAKIHITLAYNPPVKDNRIDYTGLKMSYELYRGMDLSDIIKYTCKPDTNEFEKDNLPKEKQKYKCSLTPSMAEVKRGTVLKTTHMITNGNKKSEEAYGNTYYLVVKCAKRWYEGLNPQSYALVVSIEHENEEAELYSKIEQRISERVRGKVRRRV